VGAPIHTTANVNLRNAPNTSGTVLTVIPQGVSPDYNCWTQGQNIGGVDAWFNVNYNGHTGYYTSYYDDSSFSTDSQITSKYGIPQCGASGTITISGTVGCASHNVEGIWVDSSGGGYGWATWTAVPGHPNDATYSRAVTTSLATTIRLHVGCGGSTSSWWSDNRTPGTSVSGSATLNATCSEGTTQPPGGDNTRCSWAMPPIPSTITIQGTVGCASHNVEGIWVDSSGGGGKFASWTPTSGHPSTATYNATFSTVLVSTIRLHVGCGGSASSWWSDNRTPGTSVSGSATLNAACNEGTTQPPGGDNTRCSWGMPVIPVQVTVQGTVGCASHNIEGVYVDSSGGGGKFANWSATVGHPSTATYNATFSAALASTIRLHVGCGGSTTGWWSDNRTPGTSISGSATLNASCNEGPTQPPPGDNTRCSWAMPPIPTQITVQGTVGCAGHNVEGVWIDSSGGGSKFASWTPTTGHPVTATYAATLSTLLATTIRLHVGCGGSTGGWWSDNRTPGTSIGGSATLNATCNEGTTKPPSGDNTRCSWAMPPMGGVATTTHLLPGVGATGVTYICGPTAGYSCTPGYTGVNVTGWAWSDYGCPKWASGCPNTPHNCTLYAAWRLMRNGVNLSWSANAYGWAQTAHDNKTYVDQSPAVGAIAQWNSGTGHVAYVEASDSSGITIRMDDFSTSTRWPIGYTAEVHITPSSPAWPDNFLHF
jgi:hypothetical protein